MFQEFKLEVTEDLLVYIKIGEPSIPNASMKTLKEGDMGSSEGMLATLGIKEVSTQLKNGERNLQQSSVKRQRKHNMHRAIY